jgi:hypothetical protein
VRVPSGPLGKKSEEENEMLVTWTVKVAGRSGQQMLCRDEKEAAELVLRLFLEGVGRYKIIVDGQFIGDKGLHWIWEALKI